MLPDARVASAELFVTNATRQQRDSGDLPDEQRADSGLRTLSGGQYSFQVEGYLAVDLAAAPALVVEATHAVRDVFAVLGTAADADVECEMNVDGADYCTLTIPAGRRRFEHVDGLRLTAR